MNVDPALLRREFAHVRHVATFWNGLGVSDDEQGAQVFRGHRAEVVLGPGLARLPRLLVRRRPRPADRMGPGPP